ncbi:HD domain-containing protein [Heliobacterium undosum]|uniref:HD domain-containing protein n=2 Tax=Heliomicrobium undosum TaxID=121734 RepID=A0A845L5P1_9FIRM|nr:HD domain-containing protein [Heliomicrobium undosum]
MRQMGIEFVTIGDKLARPIFTSDGQVLLGKGVVLTAGYISKLKNLGISAIYIEDDRFQDVKVEDAVSEETRREALQNLKDATDYVRSGRKLDGAKIKNSVNSVIEDCFNSHGVLVNLMDMRTKDNWLLPHSVCVCVMATMLGIARSLDRHRLQDLAVGALLHDVGLTTVPKEILDKGEDRLGKEEREIYEKHAEEGFNIIRRTGELSIVAAHVAYQHHERIDGTGFPRGIKDPDIHLYGKIVAIVDLYDKLINGAMGARPLAPHQACEVLMGLSGRYLDLSLVQLFLKNVATYPTGISVRLSTGEIGVVVDQNKSIPMRPVVRVLLERHRFVEPKEYDMIKETTIFIQDVLR